MANYLDFNGLKTYDELIKKYIDGGNDELAAKIEALVGDSDVEHSIADLAAIIGVPATIDEEGNPVAPSGLYADIAALEAAHDEDVESLKAIISTLSGADSDSLASFAEIKAELAELKGDGENSISAKASAAASAAVASLVDGAPEAFDTLKEVADWIAGADSDVVVLTSSVAKNSADIAAANAAYIVADERISAIEALIGADSESVSSDNIIDRVSALEDRVDSIREEEDSAIGDSDIESLFA